MAKTKFVQTSFNSGVLSPLIKGRTELEQYYKGLEVGKNVVLIPQGALKRRPGTEFIDTTINKLSRLTNTPTMPEGGTGSIINDDDETTITITTTNISTIDPYVIALYDLGSAKTIEFADVKGIFLTLPNAETASLDVQCSTDGILWSPCANYPSINNTPQSFRDSIQVGLETARYWRLVLSNHVDLTTSLISLTEFNLIQTTNNSSNVRIEGFNIDVNNNYLMVFTEGNCRVYNTDNNLHVADIVLPYSSEQISSIRFLKSESVMLILHEDVSPRRIVNLGGEGNWYSDIIPFVNVPQFDFNDILSPTPISEIQSLTFASFVAGDTFQIDIEGVFSKNITFSGDATVDQQNSTAFNIQKNIQDMPVVGDTGVSVSRTGVNAHTVTIGGESAKDFELFTAFATTGTAAKQIAVVKATSGSPRKEDVWSDARGYPKTACFYSGRLIFGGTKSKPQSLFMSKAGIAFDFDVGEGDADDAIFVTISSRTTNNIIDVFPGRNLQIFTDGAEFTVNTNPITPTTIGISPQTSHGSLNIEAKEVDGATLFIDRNGRSLKNYLYNFNEDAYVTQDISVLSPELIKNPVDLSVLKGTSSDDANWIFIVNNDGNATILNTLRSQDINGFTEWTTSGFIESSAVVFDKLYMVNKRTIDGDENFYIEMWDFDRMLDNSINIVPAATTISGLDYLESEMVSIVADGVVLPARLVTGGDITLEANEVSEGYSTAEVGLPFIPEFSTMPVNTNIGSGQNSMRLKKLIRMNLRVLNTSGLFVEGQMVPNRNLGENILNTAPNSQTGIIEDVYNLGGWVRDSMPVFTCPDPTPMTILAIEYEVESS